MRRGSLLVCVLVLSLVVCLGFNFYQEGNLGSLSDQNNVLGVELEMVDVLAQVKAGVDFELEKIGASVVAASQRLSGVGLSGDGARLVLSDLVSNSSFIIDAATSNLDNVMVVVEPSSHSNMEGSYIGEQDYLNTHSQNPIQPSLTNVLALVEGFDGCVIVAPVFDFEDVLVGSVSVIFNPNVLINTVIDSVAPKDGFEFNTLQLDGYVIFDTNSVLEGTNVFSDPTYSNMSQFLALAQDMVEQSAGYGCFDYLASGSGEVLQKTFHWTSVGAFGTCWRLAVFYSF